MTHTSHNESHLMHAPIDDAFGFFGTITTNEALNPDEAAEAWADAMHNLMEGPWQASATLARNFLRSRWGRHEHTWERHGQPAPLTDEQIEKLRRSEPPFA